jgi:hypothetical protein
MPKVRKRREVRNRDNPRGVKLGHYRRFGCAQCRRSNAARTFAHHLPTTFGGFRRFFAAFGRRAAGLSTVEAVRGDLAKTLTGLNA